MKNMKMNPRSLTKKSREIKKNNPSWLRFSTACLCATSSPNVPDVQVLDWTHPPLGPTCHQQSSAGARARLGGSCSWFDGVPGAKIHPSHRNYVHLMYTNTLYFQPQYLYILYFHFSHICKCFIHHSVLLLPTLLAWIYQIARLAMQLLSRYLADFLAMLSASTDAHKHYKMYARNARGRSYDWNVWANFRARFKNKRASIFAHRQQGPFPWCPQCAGVLVLILSITKWSVRSISQSVSSGDFQLLTFLLQFSGWNVSVKLSCVFFFFFCQEASDILSIFEELKTANSEYFCSFKVGDPDSLPVFIDYKISILKLTGMERQYIFNGKWIWLMCH